MLSGSRAVLCQSSAGFCSDILRNQFRDLLDERTHELKGTCTDVGDAGLCFIFYNYQLPPCFVIWGLDFTVVGERNFQ